jgi:hypothetical protein
MALLISKEDFVQKNALLNRISIHGVDCEQVFL